MTRLQGVQAPQNALLPCLQTDTQGFVTKSASNNNIFVSIRGTSNAQDWDTNADYAMLPVEFRVDKESGEKATADIHNGFFLAAKEVYQQVVDGVRAVDSWNSNGGSSTVTITGHSLGAALATLLAAWLEADEGFTYTVGAVYTFGSPRVGSQSWADAYGRLGLTSKTLRFVNYGDPVSPIKATHSK